MLRNSLKQCYSKIPNILLFTNKYYNIYCFIFFSSILYINSSQETATDDALDGEEFIKSVVAGQEPTGTPEYLLFTAPFKICKGECNESNFVMSFPIYVGIKKSAKHYSKTYPRDVNLYKSQENLPFKKSTTRHPFTLCPVITNPPEKKIEEQTAKPGCEDKVRIKKVLFQDSLEFKQHKEIALDPKLNANSVTKPLKFEQILQARSRVWRSLRPVFK